MHSKLDLMLQQTNQKYANLIEASFGRRKIASRIIVEETGLAHNIMEPSLPPSACTLFRFGG
jgi:hypothetical protein